MSHMNFILLFRIDIWYLLALPAAGGRKPLLARFGCQNELHLQPGIRAT
jgi:hypothetical protein